MPHGGARQGAGRKPDLTKQKAAEAYFKVLFEYIQKEAKPIAQAFVDKLKQGDMAAIKEMHERMAGKVKDEMNLTGNLNHLFDVAEPIYKAILARESQRAGLEDSSPQ